MAKKTLKSLIKEMDKAKKNYIKWLKKNNATDIDEFEDDNNPDDKFHYYRQITAEINDNYYLAYFQVWENTQIINFSNDDEKYEKLSIIDFIQLLQSR